MFWRDDTRLAVMDENGHVKLTKVKIVADTNGSCDTGLSLSAKKPGVNMLDYYTEGENDFIVGIAEDGGNTTLWLKVIDKQFFKELD